MKRHFTQLGRLSTLSISALCGLGMSMATVAQAQQVTDVDGNTYDKVKIGEQTWLKQNLKVTKYRNGDAITTDLDDADWKAATTGAYAVYPAASTDGTAVTTDAEMKAQYGLLYNWYAATDDRGVCPLGWRVSSDEDWKILEASIGMTEAEIESRTSYRGTKVGRLRTTSWAEGTDNYGFTMLPAGERDRYGPFGNFGDRATFWTTTPGGNSKNGLRRLIVTDQTGLDAREWTKSAGYCIRCVLDVNLPVSLIDFSVKKNQENISLTWATASEQNNNYFEVERSSDGVTFKSIGKVKGNGTSTDLNSYHLIDHNPFSGVNYYRIKQVDYDGKEIYYKIISLDYKLAESRSSVIIYPNPTVGSVYLELKSYSGKQVVVNLVNLQGRVVYKETLSVNATANNYPLGIKNDLAPGEYLFHITGKDLNETVKLLVQ